MSGKTADEADRAPTRTAVFVGTRPASSVRKPILMILVAVFAVVGVGCDTTAHATQSPGLVVAPIGGSPNVPLFVTASPTVTTPATTPANCPLSTPENLQVEPVTSPTNLQAQEIKLSVGNLESVTISSVSREFHYTRPPYIVPLPPDSVTVLTVTVKIKQVIAFGHCTYGGYTITAIHDRSGAPLVIVEQSVLTTATASFTDESTRTITPTVHPTLFPTLVPTAKPTLMATVQWTTF